MTPNIGYRKCTARVVLGMTLAVISILLINVRVSWGVATSLFGIEVLITGVRAWSPLYALFHISTCPSLHRMGKTEASKTEETRRAV